MNERETRSDYLGDRYNRYRYREQVRHDETGMTSPECLYWHNETGWRYNLGDRYNVMRHTVQVWHYEIGMTCHNYLVQVLQPNPIQLQLQSCRPRCLDMRTKMHIIHPKNINTLLQMPYHTHSQTDTHAYMHMHMHMYMHTECTVFV